MEVRILGPTEVLAGDRGVDLPGGRARAILALLALHVGAEVSSDRLIDELWAHEAPPTARTIIQGHISRLRRLLDPGKRAGASPTILRTVASGYLLDLEPDAVDAHRFQRLLAEARHADDGLRTDLLTDALRLWRGPALGDFTYEPFAQAAITALEGSRLEAVELRIDAELALHRHAALITELEQLIAAHPYRERFREQLMLALYRAGRQADALAAYRETQRAFADEMGLEPSPSLRRLERAILRHDPSLEPRRGAEEDVGSQHAAVWLPAERKRATVSFTQLSPGQRSASSLDVVLRAHDAAAAAVRRHGGRVEEIAEDTLVGFFGVPSPRAGDGLGAVRAAVELRAAIDDINVSSGSAVAASTGIDTGTVVVGFGNELPSGRVVLAAARLQRAAGSGDVLVGAGTQHLLRGSVVLKPVEITPAGSRDAMFAWRVLDIAAHAALSSGDADPPLFGRTSDLTRIRTAFRRCLRSGTPYRLTVLGEAGIGKSRLAKEFVASIGPEVRVMRTRCRPFGDGSGSLAIRELSADAVGSDGPFDRQKVRGARGFADDALLAAAEAVESATPGQLPGAMRSLLELSTEDRPVVIVVDDLHRAPARLLDLFDQIVRDGSRLVFVLCLAELEPLGRCHAWAEPGPDTDLVRLEPLRDADIEDLVTHLAGPALAAETLRSIVAASRGIPLLAEQMLAASDDGALEPAPTSAQGLIMRRIDHLAPGEREVLGSAAGLGDRWTLETLAMALPSEGRPFIEHHLDALERKAFIVREGAGSFRFTHDLVRIAAVRRSDLGTTTGGPAKDPPDQRRRRDSNTRGAV